MKNLANWIAGKNYYVKNSTKLPFFLLSQKIILSVASRFSHNAHRLPVFSSSVFCYERAMEVILDSDAT
jgi:hypothetical protein